MGHIEEGKQSQRGADVPKHTHTHIDAHMDYSSCPGTETMTTPFLHRHTSRSFMQERKLCRNLTVLPVAFYASCGLPEIPEHVCLCVRFRTIIFRGNSCMDLCGLKGSGFADNLWLLRQEAWREPQEVALRTSVQNRACMCSSEENKHSFQVHKHNDSRVCISAFPNFSKHGAVHGGKQCLVCASRTIS